MRSTQVYPEEEFLLETGDRLLIYTDGLLEATSPKGLDFGTVRLEEFIKSQTHLSADHFAGQLLEETLTWAGENKHLQADDITIVVIDVAH